VVTSDPRNGEIWWAEADDKRRPVLVVTRSAAIPVLRSILVAPVSRRIRGIHTEVALGPDQGLREECCATFDNLQLIRRTWLTERVGRLDPDQMHEICRALEALADC
jgi:mRNA interferase MazF